MILVHEKPVLRRRLSDDALAGLVAGHAVPRAAVRAVGYFKGAIGSLFERAYAASFYFEAVWLSVLVHILDQVQRVQVGIQVR